MRRSTKFPRGEYGTESCPLGTWSSVVWVATVTIFTGCCGVVGRISEQCRRSIGPDGLHRLLGVDRISEQWRRLIGSNGLHELVVVGINVE